MSHPNPFKYFKSSSQIIRLAVMMYIRFPLSPRNVEDLLMSAASRSAMRRFGSGGTGSGRCLRPRSVNRASCRYRVVSAWALPGQPGELRTPGRFRPDQPPVDPFEQGRELRRRHPHHAVPHLRPNEGAALEALVHQHHARPVPDQDLDPIGALRAEHEGSGPQNGSSPIISCTARARPSMPFRKSTGRVAT
jgi:hypothetical protein